MQTRNRTPFASTDWMVFSGYFIDLLLDALPAHSYPFLEEYLALLDFFLWTYIILLPSIALRARVPTTSLRNSEKQNARNYLQNHFCNLLLLPTNAPVFCNIRIHKMYRPLRQLSHGNQVYLLLGALQVLLLTPINGHLIPLTCLNEKVGIFLPHIHEKLCIGFSKTPNRPCAWIRQSYIGANSTVRF